MIDISFHQGFPGCIKLLTELSHVYSKLTTVEDLPTVANANFILSAFLYNRPQNCWLTSIVQARGMYEHRQYGSEGTMQTNHLLYYLEAKMRKTEELIQTVVL